MSDRAPHRLDALRRSFWLLPSVGIAVGLIVGYGLVELDYTHDLAPGVFNFVDLQSARAVLQTVATVTMSVVGLSFSVILVALQLASQQLSPRVLSTFQGDRLAQAVLAVFIGTFMYCLIVLAKLREDGVPALSVSIGVLSAIVAFMLFVAFIHHIIVSLKPATLIEKIGRDGRWVIEQRWPQAGRPPQDADAARRLVQVRTAGDGVSVRAERAGYLSAVDAGALIELARRADLLVTQVAPIGSSLVTGGVLARIHGDEHAAARAEEAVRGAFTVRPERSIVGDVGFPVRQLADIALRGLSPSLNDPTTAENAIDMIADLLVRFAGEERPESVRVDGDGVPRLVANVPDLDDLVRLGFEQIRVAAAAHPSVARHAIVRLGDLQRAADRHGWDAVEPRRQAELMGRAPAGEVPNDEDAEAVRSAVGGTSGS